MVTILRRRRVQAAACAIAAVWLLLQPAAALAGGSHPGRVWSRFATGTSAEERIVGTAMSLEIVRLIADPGAPGAQQFVIHHDVETDRGTPGKVVGGYYTYRRTSDSQDTQLRAFMWSDLAGYIDSGHEYATVNWREADPAVRLRLAITPADACGLTRTNGNCEGIDYLLTRDSLSGWSRPSRLTVGRMTFPVVEPHPVRVLLARHGVLSLDPSPTNDVHVRVWDNTAIAYNETSDCPYCSFPWTSMPPGWERPWSSWSAEDDKAAGVLLFRPVLRQAAAGDHVCLGKVPGTPCGCETCPPPAFAMNRRWEPDRQAPIRYYLDVGSFDEAGRWARLTESVAGGWNAAVGFHALTRSYTLANADFVIQGEDPWLGDAGAVGYWGRDLETRSTADWGCPAPPPRFDRPLAGRIAIRTDGAVLWDDRPRYTAATYGAGVTTIWDRWVLQHELGHALGLDHYGVPPAYPGSLPPTPGPGTGTPPPASTPTAGGTPGPVELLFPPMMAYLPDYPPILVRTRLGASETNAVNCLFYRR